MQIGFEYPKCVGMLCDGKKCVERKKKNKKRASSYVIKGPGLYLFPSPPFFLSIPLFIPSLFSLVLLIITSKRHDNYINVRITIVARV
jgi:hypothetical protein